MSPKKVVVLLLVSVVLVGLVVPAMAADKENKAAGSAELYEFIVPGAGHAWVGEWGWGAGIFVSNMVLYSAVVNSDSSGTQTIGLIGLLGLRAWEIIHAGQVAEKHNRALPNRGLAFAPVVDPNGKALGLAMNMNF